MKTLVENAILENVSGDDMAKKVSTRQLQKRISKLVREEINRSINEEVNMALQRVKDKDKLAAWLIRQYFNPQKHSDKVWYDDSVTEDNVLEYISDMGNNFPLTPAEVADMWRSMKSLKSSMAQISDDEYAQIPDDEEQEKEKGKYQTGDVSLKDIGEELGGLTPTMVNKLASSGQEKMSKILKTSLEDIDDEDLDNVINQIYDARYNAAEEFANALKESAGNVTAFLKQLMKKQYLSSSEAKSLSDEERQGLEILAEKDPENIRAILLQDIEEGHNMFKTFQAMVSKKIFPPKKRGRPKKSE